MVITKAKTMQACGYPKFVLDSTERVVYMRTYDTICHWFALRKQPRGDGDKDSALHMYADNILQYLTIYDKKGNLQYNYDRLQLFYENGYPKMLPMRDHSYIDIDVVIRNCWADVSERLLKYPPIKS